MFYRKSDFFFNVDEETACVSSHIPHPLSFPEAADGHSPSLEQLSLACSSQVHKIHLIMLGRWHKKGNEDGKNLETREVTEMEV